MKTADAPVGRRRVKIICDDRERATDVLAELRKLPDTDVVVRRLPVGDYLIDGRVLVERKTVHDFAISLVDGRLFQQATRLLRAGPTRVLVLLEGAKSVLSEPGIRRESLQGALVTLSVRLGIPVLRARDAAETARILRYTTEQVRRVETNALRRAGCRPKRLRTRQLFVLQGLPGVGPERAARLLDTCGSVAGVFAADEKTLCQIDGIGAHTAASIYQLVHAGTPAQSFPAPASPDAENPG
ncbi:MAG: ERCC4 domain-containing protein [Kiritimatiellia bacterium]